MSTQSWTLLKLSEFCKDEKRLMKFLQNRGLIPQSMNCPKCSWGMKLYEKEWKCCKTLKTKKGRKICGKKISINKNSWFERTKLCYKDVLLLTYMLIYNYQQKLIGQELGINKKTVSQWNTFVKQVFVEWLHSASEKIGGVGKTVEIDESKFRKRRYNKKMDLEEQWVFWGICKEDKKLFLVPVENRTSSTLITIFKMWIRPGSRIISDCSNGYSLLDKKGYEYLTVNHSITFVNRNTGAHSNTIESTFRHVKEILPTYSRKKKYIQCLAHYMFENNAKEKHGDLFEAFLQKLSEMKFDQFKETDSGEEDD